MKNLMLLLMSISVVFMFACGGSTGTQPHDEHDGHDHSGHDHASHSTNEAAGKKSKTELVFDEVIALHDEAMPKMGKLRGYQKTVEAKLDSLSGRKDAASQKLRTELQQLLAGLKSADKGMMDWMDSIQLDPQLPTDAEKIAYFEGEKAKAKTMRDNIFSILDSAAAKLGM